MTPNATREATQSDRGAPEVRLFTHPVLIARGAAMMWLVGCILGALTLPDLVPGAAAVGFGILVALAGALVATATWRLGTRLPQRYFEVTNLMAIIGCGVAAAVAPKLSAMLSLMLLWQGLYACSFFRGRVRAMSYLAILVAALVDAARATRPQYMLFMLATLGVAVVFVGSLLHALESLTLVDPLTGVANRRAWNDRLARELARSTRTGEALCVAMIDLDHFKAYNDEHGHPSGDRLLQRIASRWGATVRAEDFVARLGGEEFAVLLCCTDLPGAQIALGRLRERSRDRVTSSVGVAAWDGTETADALMARADIALYEAKASGRNRVVTAAPSTRVVAPIVRRIESEAPIAHTIEVAVSPVRTA